ncbi:hypothetical protein JMJ35_004012 [Cladonia borealis]|uniref:N-acetyltransferase domain-containing protein n=1 Tax=Cladonia borealis TaxID=184061 RepID=A0AA39R2F3_9LECA|nr:hypothetical protein JMJ35_004012 [Cladonia borealis]
MFGPSPNYTHETVLSGSDARVILRSKSLPLELRTPVLSETIPLLQLLTNENNIKHDRSVSALNTKEAVERFILDALKVSQPPDPDVPDRLNLVVIADSMVVGLSGLGRITSGVHGKRSGDVGIMIDPKFRGRGYAEESLRITFDYALRGLGIDEVVVSCTGANIAVQRLMEGKFGLKGVRSSPESSEFGNECQYTMKKEDIHW